jgi:Na+/phosphate symporter
MLDPQILTQAKMQAAKEYLTIGDIIEKALTEYLKKHKKDKSWIEKSKQQLESISFKSTD